MLIAEITAISIAVIIVVTAVFDALGRLKPTARHSLLRSRESAAVESSD